MTVEFADRTVVTRAQRTDVKKVLVVQPDVIFELAGIFGWLRHRDPSPHCATGKAGLLIGRFLLDSGQHANASSESANSDACQAERRSVRRRELVRAEAHTHQAGLVVIRSAEKH